MKYFASSLVVLISLCVHSRQEGIQLNPCDMSNIDCINTEAGKFFHATAEGIPDKNLKPIDPMVIDALDVEPLDNLVLHMKNLTLIGGKKTLLRNFAMDGKTNLVAYDIEIDMTAPPSNVVLELPLLSKSIASTHEMRTKARLRVQYNLDIVTNDKGEEVFLIKPEKTSCSLITDAQIKHSQEILHFLQTVPEEDKRVKDNLAEFRRRTLCRVTELLVARIIDNFRKFASTVPKSTFFKEP